MRQLQLKKVVKREAKRADPLPLDPATRMSSVRSNVSTNERGTPHRTTDSVRFDVQGVPMYEGVREGLGCLTSSRSGSRHSPKTWHRILSLCKRFSKRRHVGRRHEPEQQRAAIGPRRSSPQGANRSRWAPGKSSPTDGTRIVLSFAEAEIVVRSVAEELDAVREAIGMGLGSQVIRHLKRAENQLTYLAVTRRPES